VVVPQRELAAYGSQYVTFKTFTKSFNGRKVLYSYRDITVLLEFYLRQLLGSFNKKINKMELTLGGDHGKGAFTFIACLIVWFEDPLEAPQVLEFQIGKIDSEKDSMELLLPLVEKLGEGLVRDVRKRRAASRGLYDIQRRGQIWTSSMFDCQPSQSEPS
jgi:hypothetical protein